MRHDLKIILDKFEDLVLDLEGLAKSDGFLKRVVDGLWVVFDKLDKLYEKEKERR